MKKDLLPKITLLIIGTVASIFFIQKIYTPIIPVLKQNLHLENPSGAGKSLDMWYSERVYPFDDLQAFKYADAFDEQKLKLAQRTTGLPGEWESLGPKNIGGRTLCLAFHPLDSNLIFAGSASGGLWKTTTQGVGEDAWEPVPTGFPVLGVAAIAIDPTNPNIMFIGTGETYGVDIAEPGTVNRYTRGTYGIGILKTVDGGGTWTHILEFEMKEIKGVQDIEISPLNELEIYAATTDGVYQTLDGGDNWELIFEKPNCVDVELDPTNENIIYVSSGNFNYSLDASLSGLFKSTDKGMSFEEMLDPGLLAAWSGNAKLLLDPDDSNTIFADIQVGWFNTDPTTPAGIYKSTDAGDTWIKINNQNIAQFQGWYAHDLAINPENTNEMISIGIDAWKSIDGGTTFIKKSNWLGWEFGQVMVDTPEGDENYIHADIHAVYYHPLISNKIFFATDGGVFSSSDGGETFTTHNGGLQTTQFYPNMGSSATNPDFCIAGAQDNATYIYKGEPSWWRVIGGDGMSASVNQENDQIVFGSSQGLGLRKSTNGGTSFVNAKPNLVTNDYTAFLGPFELAPSDNDIMYAGATYLYKSTEGGSNWSTTSNQSVDGGNVITNIAISHFDPDVIFVATSPDLFQGSSGAKVFKSEDGGQSFTQATGLPNRVCKDIEFDPSNDNIVYAVFSGFLSNHVYKSTDGGGAWFAIDADLPDVPTNTILIDPLVPDDVYVGNDLGVYYSGDGGNSWEIFCEELPEATLVMDLDYSPSNRKVRMATHGHGIYQRDMVTEEMVDIPHVLLTNSNFKIFPNPVSSVVNINLEMEEVVDYITIELHNSLGQKVVSIFEGKLNKGFNQFSWNIPKKLSPGNYYIHSISDGKSFSKKIVMIN
ncbi:MAG: T9SS type A sorting domain-containing protein [Saprospiraceae bacterium]